jgi:hypothetical protein
MKGWKYINHKEIEHESGFKLQLKAGSWRRPEELKPINVDGHSSIESARLLSQGILFASNRWKEKMIIEF